MLNTNYSFISHKHFGFEPNVMRQKLKKIIQWTSVSFKFNMNSTVLALCKTLTVLPEFSSTI